MSTTILTDATDGDWETAGNWSNGVPVNGSDVVLAKSTTGSLTLNLDQAAVVLASLKKEPGCAVNIGASGSPLQIGMAQGGDIEIHGIGTDYIEVAGTADSTGVIYVPGSGDVHLASYSTNELAAAVKISGNANVSLAWETAEVAKVDTIEKSGSGTLNIGDSVTATGGGAITSITVTGGETQCDSAVTTVYDHGATYEQIDGAVGTYYGFSGPTIRHGGAGGVTAAYVTAGGTFHYDSSGTLALADLDGSTITLADNIDGCIVTLAVLRGASQFLDPYGRAAADTVIQYINDAGQAGCIVNPGPNRQVVVDDIA